MGPSIHFAQWAMSLEMAHALLGLVPSPFFTVVMQVSSRLLLMVVIMLAPTSSPTWHCGMMAISWSCTRTPLMRSSRSPGRTPAWAAPLP